MNFQGIAVADLEICLDARESGLTFTLPECHQDFILKRAPSGGLNLRVRDDICQKRDSWEPVHNASITWQLWRDGSGAFIFVLPEIAPPKRHVRVNPDFNAGEVIGEFSQASNPYPLQNIEIKVFINWLAGFGDLVLHAVGLSLEGRGYCFMGPSGSGKSTLAGALKSIPGVKILGEDNIVLRYIDDRFLIYGTPWHLDRGMCSPAWAPLEKIFFLDRSIPPGESKSDPLQGITSILQTAFIPYYRPETLPKILDRLVTLSTRVPFARAHYELGSDPAVFLQ